MNRPPKARLRIERLEIDMRGVEPAAAEAAARALGPALGRALAARSGRVAPARDLDAGRISSTSSAGAAELGTAMAGRIARTIKGPRP